MSSSPPHASLTLEDALGQELARRLGRIVALRQPTAAHPHRRWAYLLLATGLFLPAFFLVLGQP